MQIFGLTTRMFLLLLIRIHYETYCETSTKMSAFLFKMLNTTWNFDKGQVIRCILGTHADDPCVFCRGDQGRKLMDGLCKMVKTFSVDHFRNTDLLVEGMNTLLQRDGLSLPPLKGSAKRVYQIMESLPSWLLLHVLKLWASAINQGATTLSNKENQILNQSVLDLFLHSLPATILELVYFIVAFHMEQGTSPVPALAMLKNGGQPISVLSLMSTELLYQIAKKQSIGGGCDQFKSLQSVIWTNEDHAGFVSQIADNASHQNGPPIFQALALVKGKKSVDSVQGASGPADVVLIYSCIIQGLCSEDGPIDSRNPRYKSSLLLAFLLDPDHYGNKVLEHYSRLEQHWISAPLTGIWAAFLI